MFLISEDHFCCSVTKTIKTIYIKSLMWTKHVTCMEKTVTAQAVT